MEKEECRSYVYVLFRPNGEPCYVGKGHGRRVHRHGVAARNPHLRNIFLAADGNLPWVKVREDISEADAFALEVALISAIGRKPIGPLVNMTDGGDGACGARHTAEHIAYMKTKRHSPESRQRMSDAQKGIKKTKEHAEKVSLANRGKVRSSETLQRLRESHLGKTTPDSVKAKLSAALKGKPKTESHKQALRGHVHSDQTKEAISASKRGKPRSAEVKAKLALANTGKKQSQETIEKRRQTRLLNKHRNVD